MKKIILLLFLSPLILFSQKTDKDYEKKIPEFTAQIGFGLFELYNLGYELNLNYYPVKNKIVRFGPAFQFNNFYVVSNNWFNSNNDEKSLGSEVRVNLLLNIEVSPFKKSSFYFGFAPYIGFQYLNNKGTIKNDLVGLDREWNYSFSTFDFGTRYKLGGFFGKKQQYGFETAFQMSNRGIADDSPLTSFFPGNSKSHYKAYIGINFVYRIL